MSRRVLAGGCLALVALFGASRALAQQSGDVIRACATPGGQLRAIGATEACRPLEALLVWNVAGPEGPQGPQGPAGDPAMGGLRVVDANGLSIGPFILTTSFGPPQAAVLRDGANVFAVQATRDGFFRAGHILFFETTNCTGTPYAPSGGTSAGELLVDNAVGVGPQGAAYRDLTTPLAVRSLPSLAQTTFANGQWQTSCFISPRSTPVYPVKFLNLSQYLVPFRIQ